MKINSSKVGQSKPRHFWKWTGIALLILYASSHVLYMGGLYWLANERLHPEEAWSPFIIEDISGMKENAEDWRRKKGNSTFSLFDIQYRSKESAIRAWRPRIFESQGRFYERDSGGAVYLQWNNGQATLIFEGVDGHSCYRMVTYFIAESETRKVRKEKWYTGFKVDGKELAPRKPGEENFPLSDEERELANTICSQEEASGLRRVEWLGL